MKADIHPKYEEVIVTCSCGNTFNTRSRLGRKDLHLEICSKCHPFYTGEHRFLDAKGRVDTFQKKQQAAKVYASSSTGKKHKGENRQEKQPKTLRELLGEV